MLTAVVVALIFVALKIDGSLKKIKLYDQALAYYKADNLLAAEQTFSQADEYSSIEYGEKEWTAFMSGLTSIRLQLEGFKQAAQAAIGDKKEEEVLETYRRYQSFKQETLKQQDKQAASFFQSVSAKLGLEKGWSDYYLQALNQAKAHMRKADPGTENESFVHTLVLIPDEFFGGKAQKEEELNALFQRYETAKLQKLGTSLSFEDVITRTANSIKQYRQEGITAEWLQKQLERYALSEINQAIKEKDLSGFVTMAKAYQQIKDVLPDGSDVLATIEGYLENRVKQAEQYAKAHQFTKAMDLYQMLSGLLDTSSLIKGVEERWTEYDPTRLLQMKYPDKTFDSFVTGRDHWGAKQYAIGVDEAEHHLYLAAKLSDDDNPVYMDQALDVDADFTLTLSKLRDGNENPILLVQTAGKERPYSYVGIMPDLSRNAFLTRFSIEADELSAEDAEQVIVKNAAGKGENEIASFQLGEKGLAYREKLADLQPDSEEAVEPDTTGSQSEGQSGGSDADAHGNSIADVYAGPGNDYEIIGRVSLDSSIQIVTNLNGWYQIQFDGKEGWILAPTP
ncbi:SH3 domain-containing protein [Brevibacillus choshinensis]|uniref:SH3 domain-containing protein n=2 Tax=Brevibacillus choshinensis TaxID=54911 RepID=A0ABX7FYH9_BRECH|nr:SH3 domain-containing protein [Brevibacillus choshinensis]